MRIRRRKGDAGLEDEKMMRVWKRRQITTFRVISLGFFAAIITGTMLLMLPWATRGPGGAAFVDALFTSVSAVCVTGLVVQDTAAYWSWFGQVVILVMIQTGGLGVVTIALMITKVSGRKIGLMQRETMKDAISAPRVGGIVRMTGFIFRAVVLIELLGAAVLATVFCRQYGLIKGIWYALFHAVSAFCNAGFDLNGVREPFSSLTAYAVQPVVNVTIMVLIIVGGIGFFTLEDMVKNKWHLRKYSMQSKVVLSVTVCLLILPAVYFYFCEFAEMSPDRRLFGAVFQTVTTRTAGFNSVDLTKISEVGIMIMILLMLVGGSPGSTAGGMKTTTLAVLFSTAFSVFGRRNEVHFFGRRIAEETIKEAMTVLMMYLTLFLGGGMMVSRFEELPLLTAFFETGSAIATVGLSLGVTPGLSLPSKMILILLMFLGRVGGLTIIFAAVSGKHVNISKYPLEKITVG